MIWQKPEMFSLLWCIPGAVLLFVYAEYARKKAISRFADSVMLPKLTGSISPGKRYLKYAFIAVSLGMTVLALARPAWNPVPVEVTARGRDVVFVLDVSRSMLADDLKPNRLERAKIAIGDCLDVLEGDRVALLVFAGNSMVRCPLTLDYGFFRMMLADVEPGSVGRGGTKIGDALRKVMEEVFDNQNTEFKDVVLITDGGDQDSFALEAAQTLGARGGRLLAVGLGDETTGTPVLVTKEDGSRDFIRSKDEIFRSRLDGAALRKMADATPGGRYLPVATGDFDLGAIYKSLIASAAKGDFETETLEKYEEKFQIFLLLGLVLLAAEAVITVRRAGT